MASNFASNAQSIQQEIAQLRANSQRGYNRSNDTRLQDAIARLNMLQGGGAGAGGGQAGGGDPLMAERNGERDKLMALTEGRGRDIQNDPHTAAALKFLGGVTSGQDTPFNDTVRNNMLTSAAGQAASAEGAQAQMLQSQMSANGMSMTDPAAQAALRELASRRQGQVMNAANSIDSNANVQNFNARMSGANNLANVRGAQNAQTNQMNLAAAGHRSQFFTEVPTGQQAPAGMNPMYMPQPQGNARSSAAAPQQAARQPARPVGLNAQNRRPAPVSGPVAPRGVVGGAIQVNRNPIRVAQSVLKRPSTASFGSPAIQPVDPREMY